MCGIILAAAVGSTMAAEIGTMKVSEEIDALRSMSIDVDGFLVAPRLLALIIGAPILTIYADLIGVLGGAAIGVTNVGVSWSAFQASALEGLVPKARP